MFLHVAYLDDDEGIRIVIKKIHIGVQDEALLGGGKTPVRPSQQRDKGHHPTSAPQARTGQIHRL